MQLVYNHQNFSVLLFLEHVSHANLVYVAILKNFDVCTVTMGVACPLLRRSIYALGLDWAACAPGVV